jgi:alpha-tubulin suppressor-like RCC1 family protein
MRAGPSGIIPPGALIKAQEQRRRLERARTAVRSRFSNKAQLPWVSLGPQPIASGCVGYSGIACDFGVGPFPEAGRVTSVALDPSDAFGNTAYIGTSAGGVWKTVDGGQTWTPKTDDQDSLHIGAVTVDPNNAQVVYVGLGIQDQAAGAPFTNDNFFGLGILKSTDGGTTWRLLSDPAASTPTISNTTIGRIVVDPQNSDTVYAATANGIARSNDGGETWSVAQIGGMVGDVVIDPTQPFSPSIVYAAVDGVGVFSTTTDQTNQPSNWTPLAPFPGTPGLPIDRVRLALSSKPCASCNYVPPILYVLFTPSNTTGPVLFKSPDRGKTWPPITNVVQGGYCPGWSCDTCQSGFGQCDFDLGLAVAPDDPNTILVLAVDAYLSRDGGVSWSNITNVYYNIPNSFPPSAHADQHAATFLRGNSSVFFLGNDGGIYKSLDAGKHLIDLNQTLSASLFYQGAAHTTALGTVIGGAQDTGAISRNSGNAAWRLSFGGDAGYVGVDFARPARAFGMRLADPFKGLHIAEDWPNGDFSIGSFSDGIGDIGAGLFVNPMVVDPTQSLRLYIGTSALFSQVFLPPSVCHYSDVATSNAACTSTPWTRLASVAPDQISAIAIAPTDGTRIYVGTLGGKFFISTNSGSTLTSGGTGLPTSPSQSIRTIAVHPTVPTTVWVGVSGFGVGHVWESTDGGANFHDISGDPFNAGLPDAPIGSVVVDPVSPTVLYAGGDVGVFRRVPPTIWESFNLGLPKSPVNDLVFHATGAELYAFTFGRGAFVAKPARPVSLFTWGSDSLGQLGNGTTGTNQNTVIPVSGVDGAVAVAAGQTHSLALRSDGTLWSWGSNVVGQLGDGTTTSRSTPAMVPGFMKAVVAIAQGPAANHSLALLADGTVWSWGVNDEGQLGSLSGTDTCPVGSGQCRTSPAIVPGIPTVKAVAAGGAHSIALGSDGTVWAWGDNSLGESGGTACALTILCQPVQVPGLSTIVAIAAGRDFSLALKSDGTVWAWGSNYDGRLGAHTSQLCVDGFPCSATPLEVLGPGGTNLPMSGITMIAAGAGHSLALRGDGTVLAWGSNAEGQLGDGTNTGGMNARCVGAPSCSGAGLLSGVTNIAGGASYSLALMVDGSVWSWGLNVDGELSDGTFSSRLSPVQVLGADGPIQSIAGLSAGGSHGIAYTLPILTASPSTITLGGSLVVTWDDVSGATPSDFIGLFPRGAPSTGIVGTPFATAGATDGQFSFVLPMGTVGGLYELRLYSNNGMFLRATSNPITVVAGQTAAWGNNQHGQLGDGSTTNRPVAIPVQGFGAPAAISASWKHSVALNGDGTVWVWGDNGWGQFGQTSPASSTTPVQVKGIGGRVVGIAKGITGHVLAVLSDGSVWGWGRAVSGELGSLGGSSCGGVQCQPTPAQVPGIDSVVAIAAGDLHNLALKSDGTVWAWGFNLWGQVGTGCNQEICPQPVQVPGLSHVVAISAGSLFSLAVKADGTVWAWGSNRNGELGYSTATTTCLGSNPPTYTCSAVPGQVQADLGHGASAMTGITAISAGLAHSLALQADGTVLGWGYNFHGQLGNGNNIDQQTASYVVTLIPAGAIFGSVTSISAGGAHSTAVKSDGTVWAWGANDQGQIGDGTLTDRNTAVRTLAQGGTVLGGTAVSGGDQYSLALALTIAVDHTALNFAPQTVGTTSQAQSVTITNVSAGPISSMVFNITGTESSEFGATNTCPKSLAPSTTCVINVTFAPGTTGPREATLQIISDALNSPQTVSLTGTGQ